MDVFWVLGLTPPSLPEGKEQECSRMNSSLLRRLGGVFLFRILLMNPKIKLQDYWGFENSNRLLRFLLLFFIMAANISFIEAQCPACPNYDDFMNEGKKYFKTGKYGKAFPEFQAAQIAAQVCNCDTEEPNIYISKTIEGIKEQRNKAKRLQKETSDALKLIQKQNETIQKNANELQSKTAAIEQQNEAIEQETQHIEQALKKLETETKELEREQAHNDKIVDAFYFYDDSLALAFKDGKYGFINKKGEAVIDYQYEKGENFDDKGLAEMVKNGTDYLVDIEGNEYKVAYRVEDLAEDVLALDTRGIYLDSFPCEVLEHLQLEVLILDGDFGKKNNIKSIPDELLKLKELKVLSLRGLQITELPQNFGQLNKLQVLNLNLTLITELPESIGQLKFLQVLNLNEAKITELPNSIGNLTSLQVLILNSTKIKELPSTIGQLVSLKRLSLNRVKVKELPHSIGGLASLEFLYINQTHIKELPSSIGQLTSLEILKILDSDSLIKLPFSIGQLRSLKELYLVKTGIKELPSSIGNLTSLKELYLVETGIKELPNSIGNLISLKKIYLLRTPISKLPPSFAQLSSLQRLHINNTLIEELPPFIGQLSSLEFLNLFGTNITELPSSIGQLSSLRHLNLISTAIKKKSINLLQKQLPNCTISHDYQNND